MPHLGESMRRVNAREFHQAIAKGKKTSNSWMVDVHSVREYRKMKCYLSASGNAGVAIKRNGDVVSVFSSAKGSNAMGKLIPFAVEMGGKKLDCYANGRNGGLASMYARYGARATGKVAFNSEYAPADWDGKSYPNVVAMVLPKSVDDVINRYDPKRSVNLNRLKEYDDYDEMINARNRRMTGDKALGMVSG